MRILQILKKIDKMVVLTLMSFKLVWYIFYSEDAK